jgi:serine/threonine protein kinase
MKCGVDYMSVGLAQNNDMDSEGASQGRRPASTAVERTRRGSGANKTAGIDVSQHPAAVAYQAAHPKRAIPRFGPYLLLQTLGEGEFGKVKLGLHATWGEEVAVKLIRRGNVENALRMSKVEREIEVLRVGVFRYCITVFPMLTIRRKSITQISYVCTMSSRPTNILALCSSTRPAASFSTTF